MPRHWNKKRGGKVGKASKSTIDANRSPDRDHSRVAALHKLRVGDLAVEHGVGEEHAVPANLVEGAPGHVHRGRVDHLERRAAVPERREAIRVQA